MSRRVLIITSQWPPVPAIGTRRVVRLARHLPAHGWTPVLMVDDPPDSWRAVPRPLDHSLQPPPVEIYKIPGTMPGAWARKRLVGLARATGGDRAGWLAHRLTVGLALPDHFPEWIPTVVRAARRIPPVDAVWVTGRPFGLFAVGLAAAKALGVPCVLDYRDPWSVDIGADRAPHWPRAAHAALERALLSRADGVSYVNADMRARNQAAFAPKPGAEWAVIPNGFDRVEWADVEPHGYAEPTVLYAGSFYAGRSAVPALKALDALGTAAPPLQVFGELDTAGQQAVAAGGGGARLRVQGRVSSGEIKARLTGAAALLLAVGDSHRTALTGKVFDYVCAGRPIIGYGPADADAGRLVREAGLGVWVEAGDTPGLAAAFAAAATGTLPYAPDEAALAPYTAARMAARTAALLDGCVGG